jgi:hypothetical protein
LTVQLYTAALAGVGFAIGGVVRTSIAAEIVAVVVVVTFLIDLLAPALRLPDAVHQLALTSHMGQPMIGIWDASGIVPASCWPSAAWRSAAGACTDATSPADQAGRRRCIPSPNRVRSNPAWRSF